MRFINLVLLLSVVAAMARADESSPAAPVIGCDEPVFNFGTVSDKDRIEHVYVIKNTGNADLIISRVHATCGCTTANLSTNTLPPGGSASIMANLSLAGRTGEQRKTIYVESNDPMTPQFRMEMQGIIQRDVEVRPQQAVLQVTPAALDAKTDVIISFNTPDPYRVTSLDATDAPFCTASLVETTPGRVYTVVLATASNLVMKNNYLSGRVVVFTDNPRQPRMEVPVMLHLIRDVVVAPNELTVSTRLPPGTPFTQQILVRNRTREPLAVLEVTTPAPNVVASTNQLTQDMYRLEVVFHDPTAALNGQAVGVRVQRQGGAPELYEVPIRIVNN